MAGVKCWSIDQQRLNFQFTCEYGREIKGGKLGRLLKNPTVPGHHAAVLGRVRRDLRRATNGSCGACRTAARASRCRSAEMSHGAAPARFRKVAVGVWGRGPQHASS